MTRKVVFVGGAGYHPQGYYPEMFEFEKTMTAENFAGTPWKAHYDSVSPNPASFPKLVEKIKELDLTWKGFPEDDLRAITAPVLLINGDSDVARPEHVAAMFRLFGGGVEGVMHGLPRSQLAILPGTTHLTIIQKTDWLISVIKKSGHFLGGHALQTTDTAVTVKVRNGKLFTTDGPFAETKEQLGGYYLIEARDLNEAIQITAKNPGSHYGFVEVRPIWELPQP